MSEDGWLNVWACDTDLDGLKPVEESDKGAKQVEVSEDESDNEDDDVSNKKKESGTWNFETYHRFWKTNFLSKKL